MKLSHNKKRNTAFLYESLVAELTKTALTQDIKTQDEIVSILKEFFHKSKPLHAELKLYKEISGLNGSSKRVAMRVIEEAKKVRDTLDDKVLFNEQTKLINRINKKVGEKVFDNFVPSYKNLASIYQIFSKTTSIKARVLMENSVINELCVKPLVETVEKPKLSKAAYKIFTDKFNKKYADFTENQKTLLKLYIESVRDQGLELQSYINEEIGDIKKIVEDYSKTEEGQGLSESIDKLRADINSLKGQLLSEEIIKKVLKLQALAEEIKNG